MGHLIASAYNKVCIDLIKFSFLEKFFPLQSDPPKDRSGHIMCIGLLSKSLYFVAVYLKLGCPILSTSLEWTKHSTKEAETWPNHFLERMEEFTKLRELERELNKEESKEGLVVDLYGDASFETFYIVINTLFLNVLS